MLGRRLDRREVNNVTKGWPVMVLDALQENFDTVEDFTIAFDTDAVVLEEFEQHLGIVHAEEHHAPGELALTLHELVDLKDIFCHVILV